MRSWRARSGWSPTPRRLLAPFVIDHGHGCVVTDVDGNTLLDWSGGIGCLNVGHTNDAVSQALHAQVDRFLHTDFTVVPYESYVELAERIVARSPIAGPNKAVFFNSGAEAVENAVKIARHATGRPAVIAFEGAFHGRTLMAMSLTSKQHPYKAGMGPFAPEVYRAPFPNPYRWEGDDPAGEALDALRRMLVTHVAAEAVAAIVFEPVQGEGGFVVPPAEWVRGPARALRPSTASSSSATRCSPATAAPARCSRSSTSASSPT